MKEKVKKAIQNRRENPWKRNSAVVPKCPLMCWDVTAMFRHDTQASDTSPKKKV